LVCFGPALAAVREAYRWTVTDYRAGARDSEPGVQL